MMQWVVSKMHMPKAVQTQCRSVLYYTKQCRMPDERVLDVVACEDADVHPIFTL